MRNPQTTANSPSEDGRNGSFLAADGLYRCEKCQTKLGRHRFPKKLFRKLILGDVDTREQNNNSNSNNSNSNNTPQQQQQQLLVCHNCRRLETAKRNKQAPPRLVKYDSSLADSGMRRRPNNFGYCDYVDKLFGMDCFVTDIAPLRVFRSAKDVSESMAAIQAVFKHGRLPTTTTPDRRHPQGGILCLCIGDGCTPRTALLMAFLAKKADSWECVSIDPALSEEWAGSADSRGVRGLHCYKGTLKEFVTDPNRPPLIPQQPQKTRHRWRHLVLICVHSHARFVEEASLENIRLLYSSDTTKSGETGTVLLPTTIVSLPCCPTFRHVRDIGEQPTLKYDDDCVFSACRSVEVWNFEQEEVQRRGFNLPSYCMPINSYCSEDPADLLPNISTSTEDILP